MRNARPFSCQSCSEPSPARERCAKCGGPVVDANGLPPLSPALVRANALGVVGSLGSWFGDRMARRRVVRRCDEAGPLRAIVDTQDGTVRIRGRVRIIRTVRAPDGTPVAAFRTRHLRDAREGAAPRHAPTAKPMPRWIEEGSACGTFLLDDDTGVAFVDDDAFDLEAVDVAPLPAATGGTLALREGDMAEVIGPATWQPRPPELADAPLGSGARLLRFDGRPDARLLFLPLPLTAQLPIRRFRSVGPSLPGSPVTRDHEALHEIEAGGRADAERGRRS